METFEPRNTAKTITAIVTIVAIIGIVILIEVLQNSSTSVQVSSTPTHSPPATTSSALAATSTSPTTSSSSSSSVYKDGTYSADAQYYVPHGYEDIKVTLTVSSGVVTNSSIVNSESNRDSQGYQADFASVYKSSVVGKKLSEIKLSYVAGASDTTNGFNDAVSQIKTQAQG